MRIVADRNNPFVEEAFCQLGQVVTLPASEIDAAAVKDAELLVCRSTIKVGPALLDGSKVRFVATATIGTDHLDIPYLERRGITWTSAPGSNADSVQLWFACALAAYCVEHALEPRTLRFGIVGVGHVGRRVEKLVRALGAEVLLCDPPRQRAEGGAFVDVDTIVERCDVVTLHVPLEETGTDRTRGLFDAALLARLREGALLVNACRGEVVDGPALLSEIGRVHAICDVFPGEPTPTPALVDACELSTPHIAGHSLDGKVNGTDAVYRAACAFLGVAPTFFAHAHLAAVEPRSITVAARATAEMLDEALRPFYDIRADDRALREIVRGPRGGFRTYRDRYAVRREPRGVHATLAPAHAGVAAFLGVLGMAVKG
ncbi:MAG: 4-phosphoerythronate dehydrogenase [Polyangia bacterium]